MTNSDLLNKSDLNAIKTWLGENTSQVPEGISDRLERLLLIYAEFAKGQGKAKQMLMMLRQAMGILPKSERGSSELGQLSLTAEESAELADLQKKCDSLALEKANYQKKIRQLRLPPKDYRQLELISPQELVFTSPLSAKTDMKNREDVERQTEFERLKGLHSTRELVKRVDLNLLVTETTHDVETVTDFTTGKSVRASMEHVGPAGFQLTWRAIANLVKMHVGFAIPINRIAMMIGQREFSSGKICRILQTVAMWFLPIYLCLFEELSDVDFMSGDDTKTKVIDLAGDPKSEEELSAKIDAMLGFTAERADGKGDKKGLNVSLLIGRTVKNDPLSTIRFFRTHLGSVGNLLSKALESRRAKSGPLLFQGDLSSTNLPEASLRERFPVTVAGCGAHARRPFWRYRNDDENLCYWMLKAFWTLSYLEKLINSKGRTEATVLRYRQRYAKKVWEIIRRRCIAATTGQSPGQWTYRKGTQARMWPPETELYKAARYIIKHFNELTLYCDNPRLEYTNNGVERALRIEKCMLSSSKFRKTRGGRAALDILRTINATCTAANVEIADYLRFVCKNQSQIQAHPERYTPYAFALLTRDQAK